MFDILESQGVQCGRIDAKVRIFEDSEAEREMKWGWEGTEDAA